MKKYFLKSTKEEIKVGNKIQLKKKMNTFYGEGILTTDVTVTEKILKKLISDGFVYIQEENGNVVNHKALKPYISEFARKSNLSLFEAYITLLYILEISPRAYLATITEIIAEVKNANKEPGKYCWYLFPLYNYKPIQIAGNPTTVTAFYNEEDAREAYNLLLPVVKNILIDGK